MKRVSLVLLLVSVLDISLGVTVRASDKPATPVLATTASMQAPPVATAGQSIGWDYTDADVAAGGVVRFELQVDGGTWSNVGMTKVAGSTLTYSTPIPALTTGEHTVSVRACNTALCGDASTPLAFVLAVKPAPASNVRVIGG
jgi:hypothetical protein